ncbi:MAG TPA: TetR/AcrR family transcriptional regulator [Steroidobacteraceae bacterium]
MSEDQVVATVPQAPQGRAAATPRYALKKQAIVAAASEILLRDGVKGMTLAKVAASVGLITTSVTYYFKKKEDLAVACFLEAIERFDELVGEARLVAAPHARVLRLIDLWLGLYRRIEAGKAPPIAVFNDIRALEKPQRALVFEAYTRFFEHVRQLFVAPQLSFLDEDSQIARAHILTEQLFWAKTWLPRYDSEDYDRVRDRMFDILEHGLATSERPWQPIVLDLDEVLQSRAEELTAAETFLVAATRLINERGYRGASVEKISARLNVTKGSFYHHNEAKDDLVVECFKRSFEAMRRIQRAAAEQPGDQWSKLATVAATLVAYQLSAHGPLLRSSALTALPESIRHEMLESSNRVSDRFAALIADGVACGSVRAVDPFIAAQMLTATLNVSAMISRWFPDVSRDDAIALHAKPMLLGIFSE